jgi:hypothetical protein
MDAVKLIVFPIQIVGPLLLATGAAGKAVTVATVVAATLVQPLMVVVTE